MSPGQLQLRDVHLPPSPSWWPPAPGWWVLAVLVLVLVALPSAWAWRRLRRQRRWQAQFDRELAASEGDAERLARMSSLLRRAARRIDPQADRLQGEDWLRLLDGRRGRDFSQGPGRVLVDGLYQRQPQVASMAALQALVRQRFSRLMAGRR